MTSASGPVTSAEEEGHTMAVASEETAAATGTHEGQGEEEVVIMDVALQVELPTGTIMYLPHINKSECGLGIKQALTEYPESCFYTSYALVSQEDPREEVNDYIDLNEYPFIKDGAKLKMVLEDYDVRKARMHVKRLREMMAFPPVMPNQGGPKEADKAGSFKGKKDAAAAGGASSAPEEDRPKDNAAGGGNGDKAEESEEAKELALAEIRAIVDRLPPIELPFKISLDTFYSTIFGENATPSKEAALPQCLRGVCFSGWNPPPANRRLMGDLFYLEVKTLDDAVLNITAVPGGFYVNKIHHDRFDPSPAANCYFSHELITLLSAASPPFKKAWAQAVQQASEHTKFENPLKGFSASMAEGRVEAAVIKQPWNVPQSIPTTTVSPRGEPAVDPAIAAHKYDMNRCEDDLVNAFGMDERGALRDWNEDYQNVRGMSGKTAGERIVRAKVLQKVLTDFGEAAVAGAMAVVQGFVTPINPNEPPKSHVYVFNNIFFSHAVDSQNSFKVVEGDRAAFKGALHELRNLMNVNKLGVDKLYTLATSVVDYLGVRLTAQSIIPGILHGDQQSRLMYGSVEAGAKLKAKSEMRELLEPIADKMFLTERKVPICPVPAKETPEVGDKKDGVAFQTMAFDDDDEEGAAEGDQLNFLGPIEWKGIKGADGRCYVLDMVRLTPRDANWIPASSSSFKGTGVWESVGEAVEEDQSLVLRPELIQLYVRSRLARSRNKFIQEYQMKKVIEAEAKKAKEEAEAKEAKEPKEGEEEKDTLAGGEKEKEEDDEEDTKLDEETMKRIKEEEEQILSTLKFNPNAFLQIDGIEDKEQIANDEEQIRTLARFLWDEVIPSFLEDIKRGGSSPIDGEMLTDNLHQTGINIRYLGRLASMAKQIGKGVNVERRYRAPTYFVQLCETEMLARSIKHMIYDLFKDRQDLRLAPGPTIVACMNAVLGSLKPAQSSPEQTKRDLPTPSSSSTSPTSSSSKATNKKGKKGHKNKNHHPTTNGTSSAPQPQKSVSPPPVTEHGLEELREMIVADIQKRYHYAIKLFSGDSLSVPNPLALLRRICQKLGLRVASRAYDFMAREPLAVSDLVDILPVAKHCTPTVPLEEAKDMMDSGKVLCQSGNVGLAFEYLNEAASLYQQIVGPIHVEVGRCMDLMATILFQAGDQDSGLTQLNKALAMFWQTAGFDSYEAINAHYSLGLFLNSIQGRADEAIFHCRACIYLLELIAGPTSPELPTQYFRLGTMLQELGLLRDCYRFLLVALEKSTYVADTIQEASIAHQVALVEAALGLFKEALAHEKRCYSIFKEVLGEGHQRTVESSLCMSTFTSKAVEQATDKTRLKGLSAGGRAALQGVKGAVDDWTADLDRRGLGGGGGGTKKKKSGRKR